MFAVGCCSQRPQLLDVTGPAAACPTASRILLSAVFSGAVVKLPLPPPPALV